MAIYMHMALTERELKDTAERLEEYKEGSEFQAGYDTAWDVATCVNSSTMWRWVTDWSGMPEGEVLVAVPGTGIRVGYWDGSNWHIAGMGIVGRYEVDAWTELPDYPEV